MSGLPLFSNTYWIQIEETSHCVMTGELLLGIGARASSQFPRHSGNAIT